MVEVVDSSRQLCESFSLSRIFFHSGDFRSSSIYLLTEKTKRTFTSRINGTRQGENAITKEMEEKCRIAPWDNKSVKCTCATITRLHSATLGQIRILCIYLEFCSPSVHFAQASFLSCSQSKGVTFTHSSFFLFLLSSERVGPDGENAMTNPFFPSCLLSLHFAGIFCVCHDSRETVFAA